MAKQGENNIKLGVFVFAGMLALIFSFYLIGKNHNLFGSDFELKVRFSNLNGLMEGDNVLFSGIQAGTVKSFNMINDTSIEVTLMIDNKIKDYIPKNAVASIGTEGLMGNKIVNILPVKRTAVKVHEGDLLPAQKMLNTDEMLQTLSKTNNNLAVISEGIKGVVLRINGSDIMTLLNDKRIGASLRSSLENIDKTTANAKVMSYNLNDIVAQIRKGKGAAGALLTDTGFAGNLKEVLAKIKSASDNADKLTVQLNTLVNNINQDLTDGKGAAHSLLRDSVIANNFKKSMDNIEKGTDSFSQDMEALKHNFLLRGYFKNLEKQQKKEQQASNPKN